MFNIDVISNLFELRLFYFSIQKLMTLIKAKSGPYKRSLTL